MTKSIEQLRRDAKALRKAFDSGDVIARQRTASALSRDTDLKHADFLHVIAREHDFATWPQLVFAAETHGLDRAELKQKLTSAVFHGQSWRVTKLLEVAPDLARGDFHLSCTLNDLEAVKEALRDDPAKVNELASDRRPIVWLASSMHIHSKPGAKEDMLAIASLLVEHGADVNDGAPFGENHKLSALYLAIGAANNMSLGKWLLEHGADPNDGKALYHATELGHHECLKLLLKHGADPRGTNALLRAMDFNDVEAVRLLLQAGADAHEFNEAIIEGERPWVYPALHQAARRMCSPELVTLLLEAGADPSCVHDGMTAYALARAFGNRPAADILEQHGAETSLSSIETILAQIADGILPKDIYIDPAKLPAAARDIVRTILHLPGKLEHVKRLVAAGAEYDRSDSEGLTPVQVAGWEALPDVLSYLLSQKPDLSHVNGYGGTLLSTIIHGSTNNPNREGRDYIACLELVLKAGVALPRRSVQVAGDPDVAAYLADWAETYPGQVVDHGVV